MAQASGLSATLARYPSPLSNVAYPVQDAQQEAGGIQYIVALEPPVCCLCYQQLPRHNYYHMGLPMIIGLVLTACVCGSCLQLCPEDTDEERRATQRILQRVNVTFPDEGPPFTEPRVWRQFHPRLLTRLEETAPHAEVFIFGLQLPDARCYVCRAPLYQSAYHLLELGRPRGMACQMLACDLCRAEVQWSYDVVGHLIEAHIEVYTQRGLDHSSSGVLTPGV